MAMRLARATGAFLADNSVLPKYTDIGEQQEEPLRKKIRNQSQILPAYAAVLSRDEELPAFAPSDQTQTLPQYTSIGAADAEGTTNAYVLFFVGALLGFFLGRAAKK